jgi:hypothetical protein
MNMALFKMGWPHEEVFFHLPALKDEDEKTHKNPK